MLPSSMLPFTSMLPCDQESTRTSLPAVVSRATSGRAPVLGMSPSPHQALHPTLAPPHLFEQSTTEFWSNAKIALELSRLCEDICNMLKDQRRQDPSAVAATLSATIDLLETTSAEADEVRASTMEVISSAMHCIFMRSKMASVVSDAMTHVAVLQSRVATMAALSAAHDSASSAASAPLASSKEDLPNVKAAADVLLRLCTTDDGDNSSSSARASPLRTKSPDHTYVQLCAVREAAVKLLSNTTVELQQAGANPTSVSWTPTQHEIMHDSTGLPSTMSFGSPPTSRPEQAVTGTPPKTTLMPCSSLRRSKTCHDLAALESDMPPRKRACTTAATFSIALTPTATATLSVPVAGSLESLLRSRPPPCNTFRHEGVHVFGSLAYIRARQRQASSTPHVTQAFETATQKACWPSSSTSQHDASAMLPWWSRPRN